MPPKPALPQLLPSADALLTQFLDSLSSQSSATSTVSNPPPPLPLLSDCARLLKAHVTKLSLLAINKPFTPSAIASVLSEITSTCLPAMMSAVQICEQQTDAYGNFFAAEMRTRVRRVMREMLGMVREVRSVAEGTSVAGNGRDSLSSTGVVWDGCDELVALSTMGVAGLAVQKADEYRDTLKDAIAELREWREGEDVENEGAEDGLLDSDDEGVDGDRESLEDIFNAANSLPADRVELRQLVENAEEKLKKVVILYTALIKRRLKVFPGPQSTSNQKPNAQQLDACIAGLKAIPELVDELANIFYDLDEEGAKTTLAEVLDKAKDTASLSEQNYQGKEDEFTTWSQKWKAAIS